MAQLAAAVFHVSTRRYWLPAFDGSDRTLAGWTRHLTGLPVIAIGSVGVAAPFLGVTEEGCGTGGAAAQPHPRPARRSASAG